MTCTQPSVGVWDDALTVDMACFSTAQVHVRRRLGVDVVNTASVDERVAGVGSSEV